MRQTKRIWSLLRILKCLCYSLCRRCHSWCEINLFFWFFYGDLVTRGIGTAKNKNNTVKIGSLSLVMIRVSDNVKSTWGEIVVCQRFISFVITERATLIKLQIAFAGHNDCSPTTTDSVQLPLNFVLSSSSAANDLINFTLISHMQAQIKSCKFVNLQSFGRKILSPLLERATAINLVDKKLSRLNSTMVKSILSHWLMQLEEGQQQKRQKWEKREKLVGSLGIKSFYRITFSPV